MGLIQDIVKLSNDKTLEAKIKDNNLVLADYFVYGSRLYGTSHINSDYDLRLIGDHAADESVRTIELSDSVTYHSNRKFKELLEEHDIVALEGYYSGVNYLFDDFELDLKKLRKSISKKASHSYVKAKKKIKVEKDYYVGWKSLFHSLRILMYGCQIAKEGVHIQWDCANVFYQTIMDRKETDWEVLDAIYKPVYNSLSSTFKKLAPK